MSGLLKQVTFVLLATCLIFFNTANTAAYAAEPPTYNPELTPQPEAGTEDLTPKTADIVSQFEQLPSENAANETKEDEPAPFAELEEAENLPETVFDEDELNLWLEQHSNLGGTVILGNNITITQYINIYAYEKIVIETGKYGLKFDGGSLCGNNIYITGEGVELPVIYVIKAGSDSPWSNSWNNTLLEINVTATGKDGVGGTAMRISAADNKRINMDGLVTQGLIRSYGEGAIGLWLDVPMDAWCYRVEVFGTNSTAVYAPNGSTLFYCKLSAEGAGAACASGNSLTLDSCLASPPPTEVNVINRTAMNESFTRTYLPLKQNHGDVNGIWALTTPAIFLKGNDDKIISRNFCVTWDIDEYMNINLSTLGKTVIKGTLSPVFYDMGIFDELPIELTVEVRDPNIPCISQIYVRELDGVRYAVLNFWEKYDPQDKNVVLWRSDNEGKTWYNATNSGDIMWQGNSLDFTYDNLEHSVWFQLEIVGTGESNIAILDVKDGVFIGGNGGDRTGTDREGVKPEISKPAGGSGSNGGGSWDDSGSLPAENYDDTSTSSETTGTTQAGGTLNTAAIPIDIPQKVITEEVTPNKILESEIISSDPPPPPPPRQKSNNLKINPANNTNLETALPTEQTSPKPKFSVDFFIALFMGAAGVCLLAIILTGLKNNKRKLHG